MTMHQFTIRSIKHKLFAAMFLAPFIPVALALGTGGYLFFQYSHMTLLDRLAAQSRQYTTILDTYIEERISDLADMETVLSEAELTAERVETTLHHASANHPEFLDLAIVDQDGTTLFYAGPRVFKGTHIEPGKWHEDALRRGLSVSGVFTGPMGIPHWILARRMSGHGGSYTLRVSVDAAVLSQVIMRMREKGVEIFLTNHTGDSIAGSSSQIMTKNQDFTEALFRESLENPIWDERTQAAFSTQALRYGQWFLVARQSAAALPHLTDSAVLFFGVSILCGGIIVFLTSLYLTGYVEKMLHQRDEEREQLREQLYRAGRLAELGEMAAGFAHEINNPLQIMKSDQAYIEMVLHEIEDRPGMEAAALEDIQEVKSSLGQIKIQIDRCARITHSILSFGRAGAAEAQHIDLAKFIPEVLTMVQKNMQLHSIQLRVHMAGQKFIVHVDPGRLQQVLLNLFNNAIHAITETTDGRHRELSVSCTPENNNVRIAVTDNGTGISLEHQQLIFTPFFTTKPAGLGTGLGLSLCHGIVDSMHGTLNFTSTKGQGSTFYVVLPLVHTPGA